MEFDPTQVEICIEIAQETGRKLREAGLPPASCMIVAATLVIACSKEGEADVNAELLRKLVADVEPKRRKA